jgi:hypothetical protein
VDPRAEARRVAQADLGQPLDQRPLLVGGARGDLGEEALALGGDRPLALEATQRLGRRGLGGEQTVEARAGGGERGLVLRDLALELGRAVAGRLRRRSCARPRAAARRRPRPAAPPRRGRR